MSMKMLSAAICRIQANPHLCESNDITYYLIGKERRRLCAWYYRWHLV